MNQSPKRCHWCTANFLCKFRLPDRQHSGILYSRFLQSSRWDWAQTINMRWNFNNVFKVNEFLILKSYWLKILLKYIYLPSSTLVYLQPRKGIVFDKNCKTSLLKQPKKEHDHIFLALTFAIEVLYRVMLTQTFYNDIL